MPTPTDRTDDSRDDSRAEGLSGKEIHDLLTGGAGSGSLHAAAQIAAEAAGRYAAVEDRLRQIGATLGEAWTGAAAEAGARAMSPIDKAVKDLQETLPKFDRSAANQSYQFEFNRGQVLDIPAQPPESNLWDTITPWDTNTEDAVTIYRAAEAENRRIYAEYQHNSHVNRGELPSPLSAVSVVDLDLRVVDTTPAVGREVADYARTGSVGLPATPHGVGTVAPAPANPTNPTTGDVPPGPPAPPLPDGGSTDGTSREDPSTPEDPTTREVPGRVTNPTGNTDTTGTASSTPAHQVGSPTPEWRGGVPEARSGIGTPTSYQPTGFGPVGAARAEVVGPRGPVAGTRSEQQQWGGRSAVVEPGVDARRAGGVAAARAATGGPAVAGGPVGGGARGEEDREHATPGYLVTEAHGDEIVGAIPHSVPPVLGG
ncbi:hypothetical protein [Actinosynnema sp. NPDC020468]|uniref:hypothetical protein n=1 Tax=Actinosynnema sp. NPDC020468 TaxID=3154488 RepID=UPI00340B268C